MWGVIHWSLGSIHTLALLLHGQHDNEPLDSDVHEDRFLCLVRLASIAYMARSEGNTNGSDQAVRVGLIQDIS